MSQQPPDCVVLLFYASNLFKISKGIVKRVWLYHVGIHLPESHAMFCLQCPHRHFHQLMVWHCTLSVSNIFDLAVLGWWNQPIFNPGCFITSPPWIYFFIWKFFLQLSFKLCCCINCYISKFRISPELMQIKRSRFEFKVQLKSPPIMVSVLGSSQLFILAINFTLS